MTTQDKCLLIIKELELSARQVAVAIEKAPSSASDKIKQNGSNRFLDEDFKKLKNYYIEKLKKIEEIA
ncbi:hypothetical protein [Chryseobacterium sp.]|uniref:hypothetical protein n=1 Tax=Chryseobacterium sp. TaxID=1871047 RepID=UPI00289E7C9F|nr:hypothetical protein [Chryseobacterium sp.]